MNKLIVFQEQKFYNPSIKMITDLGPETNELAALAQLTEKSRVLPYFLSSLKEISARRRERLPLLARLADISLAAQRAQHTDKRDLQRESAAVNCVFHKSMVYELLSMRKEGCSPEEIFQRLDEAVLCYAVIVGLPYQISTLEEGLARKFFQYFISTNLHEKKISVPLPEATMYRSFSNSIGESATSIKQGMLGEFLAFCLLDYQNFRPRLSSLKDDQRNIDMYIHPPLQKNRTVPVQVKTDSYSRNSLFDIGQIRVRGNSNPGLLVALNTHDIIQKDISVKEVAKGFGNAVNKQLAQMFGS